MPPSHEGLSFRELLSPGSFHYGAEVVTTRGMFAADAPNGLATFASDLLADARIGWISITDSPGGAPMLPPDWLANRVGAERQRIVLHMTCKDMNRNGLESTAWRYASEGYRHLLALTGDYPVTGFGGRAEGVFDIDSVGLIALLRGMNGGLVVPGRSGKTETLPQTDFFIGCAVSPFKRHERELMPQYFKLLRKLAAGAQWIVPQLGYDMRKFNEVKLLLASHGLSVPVVGNVYLLTKGVARLFNSGKLAGCVVSDELFELCDKQAASADKGKRFFQEFAAKQLAVFKGLGFAAGYLGGIAKAEVFGQIIDIAESFGENDWRDFLPEICFAQPDEFFFFEHDPKTGLGDPAQINPAYLASLRHPPRSREVTLSYRVSRLVHSALFTRDRGLWGLMRRLYARWDKKDGRLSRLAHAVERSSKSVLYGCQDCGDCSLPDCAYLCPRHSCSKCGRNGPCGGSANGRCELDDKECFWARVYERMKYYGESERMFERPMTLYNADLKNTSSWANTYLDRDHHAGDE
jgi:methylenetetrahydrofolate reductase (NADPH)